MNKFLSRTAALAWILALVSSPGRADRNDHDLLRTHANLALRGFRQVARD